MIRPSSHRRRCTALPCSHRPGAATPSPTPTTFGYRTRSGTCTAPTWPTRAPRSVPRSSSGESHHRSACGSLDPLGRAWRSDGGWDGRRARSRAFTSRAPVRVAAQACDSQRGPADAALRPALPNASVRTRPLAPSATERSESAGGRPNRRLTNSMPRWGPRLPFLLSRARGGRRPLRTQHRPARRREYVEVAASP